MHSFFFQHLSSLGFFIYPVIFAAMIVEGDIFLFAAAFLAYRGFLNPELTFLMLLAGVTTGDWLWYGLGARLNHSDNFFNRWVVRVTGQMDNFLLSRPQRTIIISKYIYNFHHLTLVRAGVLKIKFKKFIRYDFVSNLIWLFLIGGLGYLSGAWSDLAKEYLRFAEIALFLSLAIFLILRHIFGRYELRNKIMGKPMEKDGCLK